MHQPLPSEDTRMSLPSDDPPRTMDRRAALLAGAASLTALEVFKKAHGMETAPAPLPDSFHNDPESSNLVRKCIHDGKGEIDYKVFFNADRPAKPAILL